MPAIASNQKLSAAKAAKASGKSLDPITKEIHSICKSQGYAATPELLAELQEGAHQAALAAINIGSVTGTYLRLLRQHLSEVEARQSATKGKT